jgi:hypothetical protein
VINLVRIIIEYIAHTVTSQVARIDACGYCGNTPSCQAFRKTEGRQSKIVSLCTSFVEPWSVKTANASSDAQPTTNLPIVCLLCDPPHDRDRKRVAIFKYNFPHHLSTVHRDYAVPGWPARINPDASERHPSQRARRGLPVLDELVDALAYGEGEEDRMNIARSTPWTELGRGATAPADAGDSSSPEEDLDDAMDGSRNGVQVEAAKGATTSSSLPALTSSRQHLGSGSPSLRVPAHSLSAPSVSANAPSTQTVHVRAQGQPQRPKRKSSPGPGDGPNPTTVTPSLSSSLTIRLPPMKKRALAPPTAHADTSAGSASSLESSTTTAQAALQDSGRAVGRGQGRGRGRGRGRERGRG